MRKAESLGAGGKGSAAEARVARGASGGVVEGRSGEVAQAARDLAREFVATDLESLERALAELDGQSAVEVIVGEHQIRERPALHQLGRQRACDQHIEGEVAQARQGGPG